ncbi:NAD+ kinase [Succinivibrio dextrinosolvens]|uniref:NAD(+)/NADH kinase n=1 Tax=Succinivibrio dextrinosolvens TaxID=83771 RepID=UPI0008E22AC5|nr:NAD(+)/NADH kinase [Succinivibrio dextrinosolvens]SFS83895.1 NAD+ kinase [Succinivibrio dextrinosolvens]
MATENVQQKKIKSVVIISKVYKRPLSSAIKEIAQKFSSYGVKVYIDANTQVGFNLPDLECISRRDMRDVDLIIVVGGDGSVLGVARTLVDLKVPVLGVNRGHLGLLTDVSPSNLDENIKKIVNGEYTLEERTMIDVIVSRRSEDGVGEMVGHSLATNETVIHSGTIAHMMVLKVSIGDKYMYTIRGDGIIINTPTGSTAYSLSAGGSIIEPHLDLLSLVPMFPHSLNCSPIIIPGKSEIKIEFECPDDLPELIAINCDGQVTMRADTKCTVMIRQHQIPLTLMHPHGYDYYSLLRKKLGWGKSLV